MSERRSLYNYYYVYVSLVICLQANNTEVNELVNRIRDAQRLLKQKQTAEAQLVGIKESEDADTGLLEVVVEEEDLDEQPNIHEDLHGDDIIDEEVEASMPEILKHKEVTHNKNNVSHIHTQVRKQLQFECSWTPSWVDDATLKEEKKFVQTEGKKKNGLTLVTWKNTWETMHSVPQPKVTKYLGVLKEITSKAYDKVLCCNVYRYELHKNILSNVCTCTGASSLRLSCRSGSRQCTSKRLDVYPQRIYPSRMSSAARLR